MRNKLTRKSPGNSPPTTTPGSDDKTGKTGKENAHDGGTHALQTRTARANGIYSWM
ncbi:hypothetical protein ACFFLZ_11950 [Photobacterium aphoticum]|uniref:hypothetical protein n=1 Tax=Photobacterium aphoticum TaxID=754436 RepID=UPI0012E06D4F|nr:hypothetical protein [Photobacterium aphoticum]GHA43572.1 hypothetical protein GCM10007086_16470 [Photobacterium aphoticum]